MSSSPTRPTHRLVATAAYYLSFIILGLTTAASGPSLLKLAELSRTAFSTPGLGYAALMTLMVALAGGTLFRAFESKNQNLDEWESIYWAITTMMTLGSQYQPTTTASEVIEVAILVAGVAFISLLTGALAGGRLGDRSRRLRVLAASSIGFVTTRGE